jgi:nucleoside-diphosphate-sugar epimerase
MKGLVAVTGASGFIGQHLVATLAARGVRQRLLVRRLPPLPPTQDAPAIELVIGDLVEPQALRRLVRGADTVIHLAGAIKALHRSDFFRANAQSVGDILDALGRTGTRAHVILVSSLAAREPQLSDYAASKRAGEDRLAEEPPASGWTAIRAPAVYGPGDRETLAFFRCVKRGIAPVPAGGRGRVSLIHVSDLCHALVLAAATPPAAGVYEIDDGAEGGYSLSQMATVAAGILGRRPWTIPLPRQVMSIAANMQQVQARVSGRPAILSAGKVREIFHDDWVVTDRRLATMVGFTPRFDIQRGFADTIGWYRRQKWL